MTSEQTSTTIAQKLAAFSSDIFQNPALIPPETVRDAEFRLLDNIGCALLALRVEPARVIAGLAADMGQGPCRVAGRDETTSATAAALAHGTMIQAFEMNDLGVYVHPGACVVPACFAAVDEAGQPVPGANLLAAIVAGYEVMIRISECIGPIPELDIGWHTPAFHGAIGAATSAALLLGLDQERIAQAMVIAADIAGGGLMLARLGTDIKRLHCGRGAEAGMLAALLARRGIRSRLDTLEHPDWGYCRTMIAKADGFDLASIERHLGERYVAFSRTAVKYYPVGAEMMGVIDSVTQLKKQHGFSAAEVERIRVGTPRFFVKAAPHVFPSSVSHIHFNVEYAAAMAVILDVRPVYEDAGLLAEWMKGYQRSDVRALAARITHEVDPELESINPYSVDSRVEIVLHNGSVLSAATGFVRSAESLGTMKFADMDENRTRRKFHALADEVLGSEQAQQAAARVLGLQDDADVSDLWPWLSSVSAKGPHRMPRTV